MRTLILAVVLALAATTAGANWHPASTGLGSVRVAWEEVMPATKCTSDDAKKNDASSRREPGV